MKNTIKTTIIVFIGLLAGAQFAFASNAVMSVTPAQSSTTVGSSIDVSVAINGNGNNVCVVKGTINLDNLSCQNITLANGLMAQTVPTCSAPNFTVGIPKCSSANQNLFTVSVKGTNAGSANVNITGMKIIGVGVDVAYNIQNGSYQINALPVEKLPATTTATTTEVKEPINTENQTQENNGLQVPSGVGEFNPIQSNVESSSSVSTTSTTEATTSTSTKDLGLVATALEFAGPSNAAMIGAIILIVLVMVGIKYYRKKEENDINGL